MFIECTVFRGWCKIIFWKSCVLSKLGFSENGWSPAFWGGWWWWWLLLHDVTRCFGRVFKKPYNNSFSLNTLFLDAKQRKHPPPKRLKTRIFYTSFLGGGRLKKRTGTCSTFIFFPTKRIFKILKNLAWPCLQSLAVKKSFIFCKFWAVKNF